MKQMKQTKQAGRWAAALLLCAAAGFSAAAEPDTDDLDFSGRIRPADPALFIRSKTHFNWCNSVVRGEDGTYHLFFVRFPKALSFQSWLCFSEIAHGTAPRPEGPYTGIRTILRPRPDNWDKLSLHNVQVRKFGPKYYLYYISTHNGGTGLDDAGLRKSALDGYRGRHWMRLRNNQRTGVAAADSPYGPWTRMDKAMVEPHGAIKNVTVNPSVCLGGDGRYHLIIKGDNARAPRPGMIQACGVSDSPTGPFTLRDKPAFAEIQTEDACIWYDPKRKRYYAIFHECPGNWIGMITSEDGFNWRRARHYRVCRKEIPLKDGTVMKIQRMERPFAYVENGLPVQLSFAVYDRGDAFIVFFPVDWGAGGKGGAGVP